jgi:hypothetical protein
VLGLGWVLLVQRGREWAEPPDVKNGDDIWEGPWEDCPRIDRERGQGAETDGRVSLKDGRSHGPVLLMTFRPRATRMRASPESLRWLVAHFHCGKLWSGMFLSGWRIVVLGPASRIFRMPSLYLCWKGSRTAHQD